MEKENGSSEKTMYKFSSFNVAQKQKYGKQLIL